MHIEYRIIRVGLGIGFSCMVLVFNLYGDHSIQMASFELRRLGIVSVRRGLMRSFMDGGMSLISIEIACSKYFFVWGTSVPILS